MLIHSIASSTNRLWSDTRTVDAQSANVKFGFFFTLSPITDTVNHLLAVSSLDDKHSKAATTINTRHNTHNLPYRTTPATLHYRASSHPCTTGHSINQPNGQSTTGYTDITTTTTTTTTIISHSNSNPHQLQLVPQPVRGNGASKSKGGRGTNTKRGKKKRKQHQLPTKLAHSQHYPPTRKYHQQPAQRDQ